MTWAQQAPLPCPRPQPRAVGVQVSAQFLQDTVVTLNNLYQQQLAQPSAAETGNLHAMPPLDGDGL